ncbi:MAG: succinate dehydrogenase cytochrome b subunit [Candidatus Methylomirabilia bacterium]
MSVLKTSVGRKLTMAFTGQFLLLFLLGHAAGNATLWFGAINSYAAHLHALPPLVWVFRLGLLVLLALHIWHGVTLTLENRAAKGGGYAVAAYRRATIASRTMIWSGLVIGGFLLYHLLHFTVQLLHPEAAAATHADALGRPDVQGMLVAGFRDAVTAALYGVGMIALGLHLFHGIASSVQTFGLNGPRSFPWLERAGIALALLVAAAFIAIPAGILAGLMR